MPKIVQEALFEAHPNNPTEKRFYLFCPACYAHFYEQFLAEYQDAEKAKTNAENYCIHCFSNAWQMSGGMDAPTLSPSLLSRGQLTCHSFVRDGKIQYLGDCTHAMAGQTVDLMDVPKRYLDGGRMQ